MTLDYNVPATTAAVRSVRLQGSPEVSSQGRYHAHYTLDIIKHRPHKVQIDYESLRAALTKAYNRPGYTIYLNCQLFINNALNMELYMEKQREINPETTQVDFQAPIPEAPPDAGSQNP